MKFIQENKKVSIVVPVYNVAEYLDECISTLVEQTYRNIEIILVNDGSTDNSMEICRKWQITDPRIQLYNNTNHGVSYTRNFAMERSNGDYITFVDSDDKVSEDYIKVLVETMEATSAEMSVTSYSCFKDGEDAAFFEIEDSLVKKCDIEMAFYTLTRGMPWAKLYKKEIIQKYNLKFNENIHVSEDLLFNIQYSAHCSTLAFNKSQLYGYRQRSNSAAHNTVSLKWFSCLKVYKYLFDNYSNNSVFPYIVFNYLKFLYEAKYLIQHKGIKAEDIETDVFSETKKAETSINILPLAQRVKLFICKYFFFTVYMRRK